jgi:hypothetical protein
MSQTQACNIKMSGLDLPGFGEIYELFYVPVLHKVACENESIRACLFKNGGASWASKRKESIVNRTRIPTDHCEPAEQEIRMLESVIALELAYNGDVQAGLLDFTRSNPSLAFKFFPPTMIPVQALAEIQQQQQQQQQDLLLARMNFQNKNVTASKVRTSQLGAASSAPLQSINQFPLVSAVYPVQNVFPLNPQSFQQNRSEKSGVELSDKLPQLIESKPVPSNCPYTFPFPPGSPESWTTQSCIFILYGLGLPHLQRVFEQFQVNGSALIQFSDALLLKYGITEEEERKTLIKFSLFLKSSRTDQSSMNNFSSMQVTT